MILLWTGKQLEARVKTNMSTLTLEEYFIIIILLWLSWFEWPVRLGSIWCWPESIILPFEFTCDTIITDGTNGGIRRRIAGYCFVVTNASSTWVYSGSVFCVSAVIPSSRDVQTYYYVGNILSRDSHHDDQGVEGLLKYSQSRYVEYCTINRHSNIPNINFVQWHAQWLLLGWLAVCLSIIQSVIQSLTTITTVDNNGKWQKIC